MLLKLSKFFLYAAVFAAIIVLPSTFFPFIGGKYYFLRACIEFALLFLALWWGFEAKPGEMKEMLVSTFKKPLVIALTVLAGVVLLSTLVANNPGGAFWSNFERGEGAFQFIHYYLYFVLLAMLFRTKEQWRLFFKLFLGAAVIMILYGIGAALGSSACLGTCIGPYASVAGNLWAKLSNAGARFQGSLGNAAYVAPYLMFAAFFSLYLWLTGDIKKWYRTALYWGLAAFYGIFFILSGTRGAALGVVAGVFAFLLYLVFANKRLRVPGVAVLAVLVVLVGTMYHYRNTPAVQRIPGSRLLQVDLQETTLQTRFWTWGAALKGFEERPILGWGFENFSTVFDRHFNPNFYIPGQNAETWFDRAHSIFFEYLADTGIVGFAAFIGIYVIFYREFFRKRKEVFQDEAYPLMLKAGFLALPIAYLVQDIALFDVLPIYLGIYAFLALSVLYLKDEPAKTQIKK